MSEEHKQRTREMIKVMQAYVDGQEIESKCRGFPEWNKAGDPAWDFWGRDYRIATAPDSIDWSHVAPEWKYMARDSNGAAWLFEKLPTCGPVSWVCVPAPRHSLVNAFASYKRGTVDWKDSLVERPE